RGSTKPQPSLMPAKAFRSVASARKSVDGLQSNLRPADGRTIGANCSIHRDDDPAAAERFGNYLVDRAELLGDFPELGTPYRKRRNVRRILCKPYFIYYRVRRGEQLIEIMDF